MLLQQYNQTRYFSLAYAMLVVIFKTLVERYTDVFYEVKEDYLKELEEIREERGKVFSSIGEFDKYFE